MPDSFVTIDASHVPMKVLREWVEFTDVTLSFGMLAMVARAEIYRRESEARHE